MVYDGTYGNSKRFYDRAESESWSSVFFKKISMANAAFLPEQVLEIFMHAFKVGLQYGKNYY